MIKTLKKFDDMTLYEMRECFEEGSKNRTCLDKAIKFRIKLGLDHLTNRQYLDYCNRNKEFIRDEIKNLFPGVLDYHNCGGSGNTILW